MRDSDTREPIEDHQNSTEIQKNYSVRSPIIREEPYARGIGLFIQVLACTLVFYLFTATVAFGLSNTMTTYSLVNGHQPLMYPFILLTEGIRQILPMLDTFGAGILIFALSIILLFTTRPYMRIARWQGYRHGAQDTALWIIADHEGAKIHMDRRLKNTADDVAGATVEYPDGVSREATVTYNAVDGTYTLIIGKILSTTGTSS